MCIAGTLNSSSCRYGAAEAAAGRMILPKLGFTNDIGVLMARSQESPDTDNRDEQHEGYLC